MGQNKERGLKEIISMWPEETKRLTAERDRVRRIIRQEEEKRTQLRIELAGVMARSEAEQKTHDEIVEQVFLLSGKVTDAWTTREKYFTARLYTRLIGEDGKLRSQVTFVNSEGMRKAIAMTNTIAIVAPDLAAEAKMEIDKFFVRLLPEVKMDDATQALYDLTKKLLVEKTRFKIGPDLYRFLGLELDKKIFPELKKAQDLLKMSLGSEKTGSYVRLYQRDSRTDPWKQIKIGG